MLVGGALLVAGACGVAAVLLGATTPGPRADASTVFGDAVALRVEPAVPASELPRSPVSPAGVVDGAPATASVRPDPDWVVGVAARTGIPARALEAYARADLLIDGVDPGCGIGWNTLAGIGAIESDHGRHGGAVLGADGVSVPAIRGGALDGRGVAAIADTDGGGWDGDTVWDRAVGPLQFIPATWAQWGVDANGDGIADPNQIDDAAYAAARYLCASGPMSTATGWRNAVFAYNHLDVYVDDVARMAQQYAAAG